MLAMPVLFEVIEPAPSVEEFLKGAWTYNQNNIRMKLVEPQETPVLDDVLTYHEVIRPVEGTHVVTQSFHARVKGTYSGAGSQLDVYRA